MAQALCAFLPPLPCCRTIGPGKTAVMALLGSPCPYEDDVGCSVTSCHRLLGCRIDDQLTFSSMLYEARSRTHASFLELYHTAETGGFPVPVLAAQVQIRVLPGLLYIAPLLAVAPRMQYVMDMLQTDMARDILGCRHARRIKWHLLIAQCGRPMRLSSCILEGAIMALARFAVLPSGHPGARMFMASSESLAAIWCTSIRKSMCRKDLAGPILEIGKHPAFSPAELALARHCKVNRRCLLKRYRANVVRPALLERDAVRYQKAASALVPRLGVPFSALQPKAERLPLGLLDLDLGPLTWRFFRSWCLVRCTGCWPLSCYGLGELAACLPVCPLCFATNVDVQHCLGTCPGSLRFLEHFAAALASSSAPLVLLRNANSVPVATRQIEAVGRCVHAVLSSSLASGGDGDELQELFARQALSTAGPADPVAAGVTDSDESCSTSSQNKHASCRAHTHPGRSARSDCLAPSLFAPAVNSLSSGVRKITPMLKVSTRPALRGASFHLARYIPWVAWRCWVPGRSAARWLLPNQSNQSCTHRHTH
jgi:hypothetical protein